MFKDVFLADVWRMGGGEGFRRRAVTPLQEAAGVGLEGDLGGLFLSGSS